MSTPSPNSIPSSSSLDVTTNLEFYIMIIFGLLSVCVCIYKQYIIFLCVLQVYISYVIYKLCYGAAFAFLVWRELSGCAQGIWQELIPKALFLQLWLYGPLTVWYTREV